MIEVVEAPASSLPAGLTDTAPGPELAVLLAGVGRKELSDFDRVELLKARARLRSHIDAELLADMGAVWDSTAAVMTHPSDAGVVADSAAAEIQAALSWTRRAAERQLDFAITLLTDYPKVWEMLWSGLIDIPRVRVIVHTTMHLDPKVRDQVVEATLERAPSQSTGLLAATIRRLAIWCAPDAAKKRYEDGLEERRLVSEANPDGTANLSGYQLSPQRAEAAARRINQAALQLKRNGDPRTIDQLRADLYLDLLNGEDLPGAGPKRAVVDIRADLTTLLELDDHPGELPGWGPVISDITRQIIEEQFDAEWRYTITDQGVLVSNGTTRRRPTAAQKRQVQAEAPECVWPNCPMASLGCDLDHNLTWAEHGPTEVDNLAPLCRHHHVIRHQGWTITQVQPGSYQLTSPLGHAYTTRPRAP